MSKNDELIRFSISIPRGLLNEIDKRVDTQTQGSRSEFIRNMVREKMVNDCWDADNEEVLGVLTISYDHHQRQLAQKLVDIQHDRHVNVLCTTHVHLDHDTCLEAIILKGLPGEIEKLAVAIGGLRGVITAGVTRVAKVTV